MSAPRAAPLTPEQWEIVKLFRDRLGLTYTQVGAVIGKSPSTVKQFVNDYVYYKTPGGNWARRKRKAVSGPADTGQSPDPGGKD